MSKKILTEKGAGFSFRVSSINEDLKSEIDKTGMMIVKGIPSSICNEKNANGRVYKENEINSAIKSLKDKKLFENRQLLCTSDDHPDSTFPKPSNSSHVVLDAYIKEIEGKKVLFNDWLVLDTHQGKNLQALIKGGISLGTSIRGLGKQNEDTGDITEYEYLGTDVVGNPSAGTYAQFNLTESIVVESVNQKLLEQIKSNEDNKMSFDLIESINEFKKKHYINGKVQEISSSIISDLLALEKSTVENGGKLEIYEEFKEEVLGKIPEIETQKKESVKESIAKDEDVLNKTERKLIAAELISNHLKEENDKLVNQLDALKKFKESSTALIQKFAEKAKESVEKLKETEENSNTNSKELEESINNKAVIIIEKVQKEAKNVILNLENQLEKSIHVGDMIAENFFSMKAIAESLYTRLLESKESKEEITKIESKESIIESKNKDKVDNKEFVSLKGWK